MADAIEANLEKLAIAETLDNGKTIRETLQLTFLWLLTILDILHL